MKPLLPAFLIATTLPALALAQDQAMQTIKITDNIHMLSGNGGNVGVLTGADGTFVIDDQMATEVPKILNAIKELDASAPRFLLNTHYHFDHAGGNEAIVDTGAAIFSHDNVRKRLKDGTTIPAFGATTPPAPYAALPVVTFSDEMHFHLNGQTVLANHYPNAHTDGDSVVFFKEANVVHTGDIFFNGLYPFIDTANGGSLAGVMSAVQAILDATNDDVKIIPGHGPLATRVDLQAYQDMLSIAHASMLDMKKAGKTKKEVVAAKPLADFDATWGGKLFETDQWIGLLYPSI
ncbi:MBL fold metallo-hydrolase [Amylibacter sp. SFDW26]|uniref:MBL fold metallo-hydrolase n=1 Tax=Amylibacter sp. SFDW26 TaxID=2652722 RepID=UPI00126277B3|nr:MBL fold metallo-hydrolase [Amylibacter sp. SFDW26]KAB7610489.1 MBL fold metallo-hydrolase [Amylibacter sp. SFDW26]